MQVKELAQKYKQNVIELRRYFHQHPEASLNEFETSKKIKAVLENIGLNAEIVADTGVVTTIEGAANGKTVLLRADIDALSVTELNECEYKSQNQGFMHACGHDCHISMLLGAAMILNDIKDQLQGSVKLIFQPAEEVAMGAKKMIQAGVLENVDGVFGMHIWSSFDCGSVCVQPGPLMASADLFTINVTGKGGHGSAPHQGVDAVIASSAIVMNLQTMVSREFDPLEPVVVSIGSINSGTRFNVIASEGVLEGTTRCFNHDIRDQFPKTIERIAKETAQSFRAEADLKYTPGTSAVINDEIASKIAEQALNKINAKSISIEKITGGEDFSEYMKDVPGVMALLGCRNKEKDAIYPQHHPKYTVDEDALEIGSALYAQYAQDFLNQ